MKQEEIIPFFNEVRDLTIDDNWPNKFETILDTYFIGAHLGIPSGSTMLSNILSTWASIRILVFIVHISVCLFRLISIKVASYLLIGSSNPAAATCF